MSKNVYQLIVAFTLAYLFIKWIPVNEEGSYSDMILVFVLHPLEFFAGALAFVGGVILYGEVIKSVCVFLKSKNTQFWQAFLFFALIFSAGYLFQSAFLHSIVFFSTALIYVIIFLRH